MQPGSVIVDMAVTSGGNVEGSVLGETVEKNGVKIIGMKIFQVCSRTFHSSICKQYL